MMIMVMMMKLVYSVRIFLNLYVSNILFFLLYIGILSVALNLYIYLNNNNP